MREKNEYQVKLREHSTKEQTLSTRRASTNRLQDTNPSTAILLYVRRQICTWRGLITCLQRARTRTCTPYHTAVQIVLCCIVRGIVPKWPGQGWVKNCHPCCMNEDSQRKRQGILLAINLSNWRRSCNLTFVCVCVCGTCARALTSFLGSWYPSRSESQQESENGEGWN